MKRRQLSGLAEMLIAPISSRISYRLVAGGIAVSGETQLGWRSARPKRSVSSRGWRLAIAGPSTAHAKKHEAERHHHARNESGVSKWPLRRK